MNIDRNMRLIISSNGGDQVRTTLAGIDAEQRKVAQSTEDLTQKSTQHGRATSALSGFIREQRTEQREHNFLFREARNVIGTVTFATLALSQATAGGSKEVQQMSKSLVMGFSAFQASSFAMSSLGIATGGWSLAIQAVLGIGAAFLAFVGDSATATEAAKINQEKWNKSITDFTEGIGKTQAVNELSKNRTIIAAYDADIQKLKSTFVDFQQTSEGGLSIIGKASPEQEKQLKMLESGRQAYVDIKNSLEAYVRGEEQGEAVDLRKTHSAEELAKALYKQKKALEEFMNESNMEAVRGLPKSVTASILADFEAMKPPPMDKGIVEAKEERIKELEILIRTTTSQQGLNRYVAEQKKLQEEVNELTGKQAKKVKETETVFGLAMKNIGHTIRSEIGGAWTDVFGEANSLLEKFALDFVDALVQIGIAAGLTALGIPVPGFSKGGGPGMGDDFIDTNPTTKRSGGKTNTIVIYANDAKSFQQMLNTPENRRSLVRSVSNAAGLGIS